MIEKKVRIALIVSVVLMCVGALLIGIGDVIIILKPLGNTLTEVGKFAILGFGIFWIMTLMLSSFNN